MNLRLLLERGGGVCRLSVVPGPDHGRQIWQVPGRHPNL